MLVLGVTCQYEHFSLDFDNLAGKTKTIWDPFCGTGTILLEALLMQKNFIASDLSSEMVQATKKNLTWLNNLFKNRFNQNIEQIFTHDAKKFINITVDAIITEGYLGQPLRSYPQFTDLKICDEHLSNLYKNFFKHARKNKIKTIVLCLPVYKMKNNLGFMEKTLESILQSGYNRQALSTNKRKSLLYSRDNQFVFREIFRFSLD